MTQANDTVTLPTSTVEFIPNDVDAKVVGERVRRGRETQYMSQADLANESGLAQPTISRIERGESLPSANATVKICRALRCSSDWLLCVNG